MMKTRLFLLTVLLIINYSVQGQPTGGYLLPSGISGIDKYQTVDSAYLKLTYRLTSVRNVENPEKKVEDIQILQIGSNISKYYSQLVLEHSLANVERAKKGAKGLPRNPYKGSYGYEIFKNHPLSGFITVTDLGDFPDINYLYQEKIPAIEWNITSEVATILGYNCNKATTTFRGRDWEAWFTMQIPVNNGPWKFGGLPGIIMKISDSQDHYDFECIGIEQPNPKEIIKFYDIKFTRITREDLEKLYRRYHKDWVAFGLASGIKTMMFDNSGNKGIEIKTMPPIPYNPIER